jgi:hypothetical protein
LAKVSPTDFLAIDPSEYLLVKVSSSFLDQCTKADRDREAGEQVENGLNQLYLRIVLRSRAEEEPVVDVWVREHELEDDCHEDQCIRELLS